MSIYPFVVYSHQNQPICSFNNIIQYSKNSISVPSQSQMHRISLSEFNKRYKVQCIIGQGSFGRILKIKQLQTNECYALKKINVDKKAQKFQFMKEIQIQKRLSHPLIIKIFEFYIVQNQNQFFKTGQQIGIIMQLGNQSLQQIIENKNANFSIDQILKFAIQFIYLFAWLQQKNIVHRDIKPANIINFSERLDCKLADFGLCRNINEINRQVIAGSIHYLSPLLKKKYYNKKFKTVTNPFKDDMYSLGMTLYELTTKQMKRQKIEFPYLDVFQETKNQDLAHLINLMLQIQETKRPDFIQLCSYIQKKQFFYKLDQKSQMEIESLRSSRLFNSSKNTLKEQLSLCSPHDQVSEFSLATIKNNQQKISIKSVKRYFLNTNTQIQSLQILDNYIFAGCTDGNIKVFDSGQQKTEILHLGKQKPHKKQVSVLCKDKKGTLWSASGDGSICKWNRKKLFEAIKNNVNHYKTQKKNIFGKKTFDEKLVVELSEDVFKKIQIPFLHNGGISAMMAFDQNNFIVGFYDGFLYIMWDGQQIHIKHHNQPITALRINNQRLYSSSFQGVIKVFNLQTKSLQNKFYQINFPICNFEISTNIQSPIISIITVNGKNILIQGKQENCQIEQQKLPTNNIFTTYITNQVFMYLSENGEIYNNLELLYKAESRGWNCMIGNGGRQIIAASFQGEVIILSW